MQYVCVYELTELLVNKVHGHTDSAERLFSVRFTVNSIHDIKRQYIELHTYLL